MKTKRIGKMLQFCLSAVLCAAVGAVLAQDLDFLYVARGREMPMELFFGILGAGTAVAAAVLRHCTMKKRAAVLLSAALAGTCLTGLFLWGNMALFRYTTGYVDPDGRKDSMFAEQKVMMIVPHQDDDINILGGAVEEYIRHGSEVYGVFVTNGDYFDMSEIRFREAIDYFAYLGVPEENVIFLGYGDQWDPEGPHIYNAEPGVVMKSYVGRTETYGTGTHPSYRTGNPYTIDNLMTDMESLILEYRPDVIFCSDYDYHIDHKSTTLLFDKVMGRLLKANPDYRPAVYKAFAYNSAWYAREDFYAENLASTLDVFTQGTREQLENYRWEGRVRLPVQASTLSRSLAGSKSYRTLEFYKSQTAVVHAEGIVNGDKVFWERPTTSLCIGAEIMVSSGNGALLNDFMLLENYNISDEARKPYDGVWTPEAGDGKKKLTVTLREQSDLFSIVLYDHPSPEENVLQALIEFDDGTRLETGPLDPIGAATVIPVEKAGVSAFSVILKETEGAEAGVAEVEAFPEAPVSCRSFIQLMDREGNFVYDYITEPSGVLELSVYSYGELPQEEWAVSCDNERCSAVLEGGRIVISCPEGEETTVTVSRGKELTDSACIRNPGTLVRKWLAYCRDTEQELLRWEVKKGFPEARERFVFPRFCVRLRNLHYRLTH